MSNDNVQELHHTPTQEELRARAERKEKTRLIGLIEDTNKLCLDSAIDVALSFRTSRQKSHDIQPARRRILTTLADLSSIKSQF